MFKKLAIGDRMALFTDPVFANPEWYHHTTLWIAAFAYLIQVYCDFSGYSDMAMGTAHLLGYRLAWNFNLPYLAPNVSEFWRRWHITLSNWLRDYVFIPLGGSRRGEWIAARNLIIVMTLGGLWHGAGWNFVLFGLIQGVWLATHRKFRMWCEKKPTLHGMLQTTLGTGLRIVGTMTLFTLTLVVFRCPSMSAAIEFLGGMFGRHPGMGTPMAKSIFAILATILILGYAVARNGSWQRIVGAMPSPLRGFGVAMMMCIAMLLAPDASRAFIYFDF
jgi:D-alanyl-lipoteichoic acid acyltransferase DltB (MBOAT superfamily)